jgi:methylated-DNA-protein-cysteine methyltransferase related protein
MMQAPNSQSEEGAKHDATAPSAASQAERRAALFTALALVPVGHVVSYGQLAECASLGRAARWVGRTLSQLPEGSALPWHRVVAAGGRISLPADSPSGREQRHRLRDEGVLLRNDRVDMTRYGWRPMEHSG